MYYISLWYIILKLCVFIQKWLSNTESKCDKVKRYLQLGFNDRMWTKGLNWLCIGVDSQFISKDAQQGHSSCLPWPRKNCPTIWGPLLQCPAMARSSGTCRDSPTLVMHLVSTKQLHCEYLRHTWWDISKNCCFSTPFLRVNQLSLHLHLHKTRTQNPPLTPSINMARPTPAAGFAPGSTNSTIFQQTVKPNLRAARPWDIPRSGSRLGQFFGSVRWFFVLEPTTSQKPTLQQKQVLNEIEFSDPSSLDLQQAWSTDFFVLKHQPAVPTDLPAGKRLCAALQGSCWFPPESPSQCPRPQGMPHHGQDSSAELPERKHTIRKKHGKNHDIARLQDDLSEFHHGNLM